MECFVENNLYLQITIKKFLKYFNTVATTRNQS